MKVAIVHDYLVQGIRGAERVVLEMHECYPDAPIYTLLFDAGRMGEPWGELDVRTSWLQKMPGALKLYEKLYLLMPDAVEGMTFPGAEVILSSSSAWAKNIRPGKEALHVCYCYTPARFLWHWTDEYVAELKIAAPLKAAVKASLPGLRAWDRRGSKHVSAFIAISRAVQERIKRYYGRDSLLIYPPVDTERFQPGGQVDDYFLVVSTLNPYKRVDLAVSACTRIGAKLVVVGDGPELERLKSIAGPTIVFSGKLPDNELPGLYAGCRAFLMPQEEDFGIAPLEAQASGRPVIALGAGGALETIVNGETGLFISEQTEDAIVGVLKKLDAADFSPEACRRNALRFSREVFRQKLTEAIAELHERWTAGKPGEREVLV